MHAQVGVPHIFYHGNTIAIHFFFFFHHLSIRVRRMTFMLSMKCSDCFSMRTKSSPFISFTTQKSPPLPAPSSSFREASLALLLACPAEDEHSTVALRGCLSINAISPNISPGLQGTQWMMTVTCAKTTGKMVFRLTQLILGQNKNG